MKKIREPQPTDPETEALPDGCLAMIVVVIVAGIAALIKIL